MHVHSDTETASLRLWPDSSVLRKNIVINFSRIGADTAPASKIKGIEEHINFARGALERIEARSSDITLPFVLAVSA